MKKIVIFLTAICLSIIISGCINTQLSDNTTTEQQTSNETQSSSAETADETKTTDEFQAQETNSSVESQPQETAAPIELYKGTVSGKYDVEIVSSRLATDYDNNPCIIITYNFTNNSDKNAAFLTSVGTTVFQNSIECNTAVIMSDVMDAEPSLSQVQPGGTITVDCAYSLHDTVNPVTVQVAPLFNLSGDIDIQRIFTLS